MAVTRPLSHCKVTDNKSLKGCANRKLLDHGWSWRREMDEKSSQSWRREKLMIEVLLKFVWFGKLMDLDLIRLQQRTLRLNV